MSSRARLTDALNKFTQKLLAVAVQQAKGITLEDCIAIAGEVMAERGVDEFDALNTRFGCRKVTTDLLPEVYTQYHEYATIILTRGVSANYGWSANAGVPNRLRDRWLLMHDPTESLWEVRGKLSPDDIRVMETGEVLDVSGIARWEAEFKRQQSEDEL